MDWKKDEINIQISRLLDTIVNLAMEDEIITDEENNLIEVIRLELWQLETKFIELSNKDLSDKKAAEEIKQLIEQVLSSATDQAKEDGTITSDELKLIDRLAKFLRNKNLVELIN